jgi:hypothetical protein
VIPAAALAQAWQGTPPGPPRQVTKGVVNAAIVTSVARRGDAVLTGDPRLPAAHIGGVVVILL